MPVRDRNDSIRTARNLGNASAINGDIGFTFDSTVDRNDYYRLNLRSSGSLSVTLGRLRQNADLAVLSANGRTLARSRRRGRANDVITLNNLAAGNYFVQVLSGGATAQTNYRLSLNTSPTVGTTSLTALRGGLTPRSTIILNTTLNAIDSQRSASQLTYTLTGLTRSGSLFRSGTQLAVGSTFTQADINSGAVSYQQQILRTIPNSAGVVGRTVISGANVAWISGTGDSADVYFYNGTTNTTTRLTNDSLPNSNVQISGSNVVWDTRYSPTERDVQYSVNGGTAVTIDDDPSGAFDDFNPKISGSRIAFQRNELSGDANDGIYQYEITTGTRFARLPGSESGDTDPINLSGISGRNVVWATSFGTAPNVERDVFFYNVNTNTTTRLDFSSDFDDFNPLISNSHVAFQRNQLSGDTSDGIYLYNISTGATSLVPSSNVSSSGLFLRDLSTAGSTVVWNTVINDVSAAYVSNGTQTSVLTATSGGQGTFPSISSTSGTNVAFSQGIGIYLYFSNGTYQHISRDTSGSAGGSNVPFISGSNVVWRDISSDTSSRLLLYSGASTNDSFNFTVSDGLLSTSGTLNIT